MQPVGFGALAVHPDTGLLCDCRQLLGGAGHLRDAVADAADQLAQGCRHAHYPALQGTDLIPAADVPLVGQVASGDIPDHGKRFGEGMRDLAGNQPAASRPIRRANAVTSAWVSFDCTASCSRLALCAWVSAPGL